MIQMRGQRLRFYPTTGQRLLAESCFGVVQMVYNQALFLLEVAYRCGVKLTINDVSRLWTTFRREHPHLQDVPSTVATQALRHLQTAFARFFADVKAGRSPAAYPQPKGKFWSPSASLQIDPRLASNQTFWKEGRLQLPGFGVCKVRGLRREGSLPKTVTLSRDGQGRYWLSFNHEVEIAEFLAAPNEEVGIDLGIKHFATLSTGEKIDNPRLLQKSLKKLRREQRALSRCEMKSRRREKRRRRVARLHAQVGAQRQDFLQKTSTELLKNFRRIAVEDLNVKGMVRNRRLARHISDCGLGEFVRLLDYKAKWYGRDVVKCGRWDPTSQVCSSCGDRPERKLSLAVREWTCSNCGTRHDRDINAAKNVLRYAALAPGMGVGVEGSNHRAVGAGSPTKRELSGRHVEAVTMTAAA